MIFRIINIKKEKKKFIYSYMLIYQEFLVLNEELASFDPNDKLRWAVHEIIIKLKINDEMKFDILSKKLKEYKIEISTELLTDIFKAWDTYQDPNYSIFKKEDKNWMEVWPYAGYVKHKARDKQNFGKHRKKDTTTYGTGYSRGGYDDYGNRVWKDGKWISKNNKDDDDKYSHYYGD